jgi:hypothetical protein
VKNVFSEGAPFDYSFLDQSSASALTKDLIALTSLKSMSSGKSLRRGELMLSLSAATMSLKNNEPWMKSIDLAEDQLLIPKLSLDYGVLQGLNMGIHYMNFRAASVELLGISLDGSLAEFKNGKYSVTGRISHVIVQHNRADLHSTNYAVIGSMSVGSFKPFVGAGVIYGKLNISELAYFPQRAMLTQAFTGIEYRISNYVFSVELGNTGTRNYQGARLGFIF